MNMKIKKIASIFLVSMICMISIPLRLNNVYASSAMAQNILTDTSLGLSEDKKRTLSAMSDSLLNEGYEPAFVAGMLGNFAYEGSFGKFESSNYTSNPSQEPDYLKYMDQYWNYRAEYSGQSIVGKSLSKVYSMICVLDSKGYYDQGSRCGFGLGCAQWTFGRTKGLIEMYMKVAGSSDTINAEQVIQAEGLYMVNEINNSYHYVYNNWKTTNSSNLSSAVAAESAGRLVCTQYEKPSGYANKQYERGQMAARIYTTCVGTQTYTVNFNTNGGEVNPGSIIVQANGTYDSLPTPSRSGYDFAGWFDESGRQVWDGVGIYTNGNHTLYAYWNPVPHTVWLDTGGNITVYTDGTYSGLPIPSKYGYDFVYWTDESGRQVSDGTGIYTNADHTLYAHWNPKSVKVNLNANGGLVSPDVINVNFDGNYNNLPSNPTKEGYNFNGWFDENENQVDFNTKVTNLSEHTLVAKWSKDKFMITFDAMGGTVETANKLVIYDNKYGILPTPERRGYEFKGWYLEKNFVNKITSSSIVNIKSNQEIYAKWELKKYYITFDANGGQVDETKKRVVSGKKYGVLPEPIKTNSKFMGWFTSDGTQINSSSTVEIDIDTILYARWQLIGDINADEKVNIADAVKLQEYLLAKIELSEIEYGVSDINGDGSTNAFDMVFMRKLLIER